MQTEVHMTNQVVTEQEQFPVEYAREVAYQRLMQLVDEVVLHHRADLDYETWRHLVALFGGIVDDYLQRRLQRLH